MVRLPDLVNEVRRKANEISVWVKNPDTMAQQQLERASQKLYEETSLPEGKKAKVETAVEQTAIEQSSSSSPTQTFKKVELKGSLNGGRYTVEDCLEADADTKLYLGKTSSGETVWIKEYSLSKRTLNAKEITERKRSFEQFIKLNARISCGPDFRILKLLDTVASFDQPCCYLISKPVDSITLAGYLEEHGRMSARQIREVLRQVLQTLWFLHGQQVCFTADASDSTLPHGNLNLASLRIRQTAIDRGISDPPFFVYLTNLQLWEHLFPGRCFRSQVANSSNDLGTVGQDLRALGQIGYQLAGGAIESTVESQLVKSDVCWEQLGDRPLQEFIQQLLQIEPSASSPTRTEIALQELRYLPFCDTTTTKEEQPTELEEPEKPRRWLPILLLSILFLSAIATLIWWPKSRPPELARSPVTTARSASVSRINSVGGVPDRIDFLVERNSEWSQAMGRFLTLEPRSTLREILSRSARNPNLKLYRLTAASTTNDNNFIRQIKEGEAEVGLTRLSTRLRANLPDNWTAEPVAYDGLAIFVPASDAQSLKTIVGTLENTISIAELGRLFTSKTPQINGQPVKLYYPENDNENENEAAARAFEDIVLKNNPELIEKFRQLRKASLARDRQTIDQQQKINQYRRNDIYARMTDNFKSDNQAGTISIGFDRISRMFNQCSVYPLQVSENISQLTARPTNRNQVRMVSPLVSEHLPITSDTDLCNTKSSYYPNLHQRSYYPLQYPLGVVFPSGSQTGQSLLAILKTDEGQYYLSQAGLMPIQPLPDLMSKVRGSGE